MSVDESKTKTLKARPEARARRAERLLESPETRIPYDPSERVRYRDGKGAYASRKVRWPFHEGRGRFGEFPLVVVREHFRRLGYVVLASEPRLKADGFILLSYPGKRLTGDPAYRRMEQIFGKERLAELNARADQAKRKKTGNRSGGDPDLFVFRKGDPADRFFVEVKDRDHLTGKQKATFRLIRELCRVVVARLVAVPKWQWQPGVVDRRREHIELRHGDAAESAYEEWCPIAVVGKPKDHVFPVSWLVNSGRPDYRRMIADTRKELDFYLVEHPKDFPDTGRPWEYAIYHCGTGANMYSKVHWSYFPSGRQGDRHSSMVVQLSADEAVQLFGNHEKSERPDE
jgi:hypothetical protein